MATKKPTPPSKYASQAVKDAYQLKLQQWQNEQDDKKSGRIVRKDDPVSDSVSVPELSSPAADGAAGDGGPGRGGADPTTGQADDGIPETSVTIEVDEVPDPTIATDEQIAAVREKLVLLADDAAGHDERQRLLDWLSAVPTWIPVADPEIAPASAAALKVVCDATNNSSDNTDSNRLNVDLVPAAPIAFTMVVDAPAEQYQRHVDQPVDDSEEFWDEATRGDVRFAKGGEFGPAAKWESRVAVDAAQDGSERTVVAAYEHGNLLWAIVSRPDVKIHVTDRNVAAELVRLGLNNVFLDYPDRSAEPLHVARSVAESLPALNVKRKRYTTKSGQTQNLGGVVVPAGPDGLVLEHDDHRLHGFVGYYLRVEDVTD